MVKCNSWTTTGVWAVSAFMLELHLIIYWLGELACEKYTTVLFVVASAYWLKVSYWVLQQDFRISQWRHALRLSYKLHQILSGTKHVLVNLH
jgi:uncharacterized membrane protein